MRKNRPCYLKAVVIVHGKSEKQICEYIKSNLRLKIEIVSEKRGEKSIQINGLMNILNDSRFRSFDAFIRFFEDVEVVVYNRKKMLAPDFKIFIIMDTDDCSEENKRKYTSKEMFKKHWAYEYIEPIYDMPDLENVLEKAKIKFEKKGIERKKEYIKIFPTDKKYTKGESIELKEFRDNLERVTDTNMNEFIEFCIRNA